MLQFENPLSIESRKLRWHAVSSEISLGRSAFFRCREDLLRWRVLRWRWRLWRSLRCSLRCWRWRTSISPGGDFAIDLTSSTNPLAKELSREHSSYSWAFTLLFFLFLLRRNMDLTFEPVDLFDLFDFFERTELFEEWLVGVPGRAALLRKDGMMMIICINLCAKMGISYGSIGWMV